MTDLPLTRNEGDPTSGTRRVHLLEDAPASVDAFQGQAHIKLAKAITTVVCTEAGGRVIGLEGPWGSGKSTTVSLIESELESRAKRASNSVSEKVKVLIFDAWAHQGDPLRRTFLEQLIEGLSDWLDPVVADTERKKLTGKTSKEHSTTSGRLTAEGKVASASVLLVPLGAAFFENHVHSLHHPLIFAGVALLLAPILVVVGYWALTKIAKWRKTGRTAKGKTVSKKLMKAAERPTFTFFSHDQDTDVTTERVENGDPTSVEFEEYFSTILKAAIADRRRLMIVLDNLDRVGEDDARAILATMQTFTASTNRRNANEWARRVWILIPFDLAGLTRLWERPSRSDLAADEEGPSPLDPTARAFFEKIFELRFVVPPLVRSDWRDYLLSRLKEAFPEHEESELGDIVRLRSLYPTVSVDGPIAQEQPTPRQLTQYINQIVTVMLQRDDIPLLDVAYFTLLQRDGEDIETFVSGEVLEDSSLSFMFGVETQANLCALYFGTPSDLGQQLLLRAPLETALARFDSDRVLELSNRPGFVDAVDSLEIWRWSKGGAVELTRAVATLERAGVLRENGLKSWVEKVLAPVVDATNGFKLADEASGEGLAVLCSLKEDAEVRDGIFKKIQPIGGDATNLSGELQGLAALGNEAVKRNVAINVQVTCNGVDGKVVGAAAEFSTYARTQATWKILHLPVAPDALAKQVIELASSADNPLRAVAALPLLIADPTQIDLDVLVTDCAEVLRTQEPTGDPLDAVTEILDRLNHTEEGKAAVLALSEDGSLMHHLNRAQSNSWFRAAGDLSMLHLQEKPSTFEVPVLREAVNGLGVLRSVVGNPTSNMQLAEAQTDWLIRHSNTAASYLHARLAADPGITAWVDYHLLALNDADKLSMNADLFVTWWGVVERALGEEKFRAFCRGRLENVPFRGKILSSPNDVDLALRLIDVDPLSAEARSDVANWASGLVGSATKDDWLAALTDISGGPLVALSQKLHEQSVELHASNGLHDAVLEYAVLLQDGGAGWRPTGEVFKQLTGLLPEGSQRVLASELCARLEARDGNFDIAFLSTYGDFLNNEVSFREHQKLPNVIDKVVAHDRWDLLAWFVEMIDSHPDAVAATNRKAELDHLRTRVAEKREGLGDSPEPLLDQLSSLLS